MSWLSPTARAPPGPMSINAPRGWGTRARVRGAREESDRAASDRAKAAPGGEVGCLSGRVVGEATPMTLAHTRGRLERRCNVWRKLARQPEGPRTNARTPAPTSMNTTKGSRTRLRARAGDSGSSCRELMRGEASTRRGNGRAVRQSSCRCRSPASGPGSFRVRERDSSSIRDDRRREVAVL